MNIAFLNTYKPNVLHFHGDNIFQLSKTIQLIKSNQIVSSPPKDLAILSCWTNDEDCILLEQCRQNNIPLINIIPDDYDRTQEWYMPNKIHFVLKKLQEIDNDIVLFVDGYDVLFTGLSDIIDKFKQQKYRILYNASCSNYPNVIIDRIYNQPHMGTYRFFNAGCCIGYREDLVRFYKEVLEFINTPNSIHSEQYIVRLAYSKYSLDSQQDFIGIDYQGIIFQSMGYKSISYNSEADILFVSNTSKDERSNVLVITYNRSDQLRFDKTKYNNNNTYINVNLSNHSLQFIRELVEIQYIDKIIVINNRKIRDQEIRKIKDLCTTYGIDLEMVE